MHIKLPTEKIIVRIYDVQTVSTVRPPFTGINNVLIFKILKNGMNRYLMINLY